MNNFCTSPCAHQKDFLRNSTVQYNLLQWRQFSVLCLDSTWNVFNVTKELNFSFYLILINWNVNLKCYMWLVAILLDSTALEYTAISRTARPMTATYKLYWIFLSKVIMSIYMPISKATTSPYPGQYFYLSDFSFLPILKV